MEVERVQAIATLSMSKDSIPIEYIRFENEQPAITTFYGPVPEVPVIDFGETDEKKLVERMAEASKEWGLFQIVNHNIPNDVIKKLQQVGKEFFELPLEEKEKYGKVEGSTSVEGYGTKLQKEIEGKKGWVDHLFHKVWPPSSIDYKFWPQTPSSYREANEEYTKCLHGVADKLFRTLSLGLGLEGHEMKEAVGGEDMVYLMKINYYPPCPRPDLALGVVAHTDMSSLTILVPNDVQGLQVFKDDHWFDVECIPNALIVHIGDQLESNASSSLEWRSFALIFLTSLIGVTLNQNFYFEGLYLASSSMASAMTNLVPAVTFIMASIVGLERVDFRSLRSIGKVMGTILCVTGAISMAMVRGPKLLNTDWNMPPNSVFTSGTENWLLGCLFLFGSCCCWSFWLVLQVPVSASYPDHLSLSAWTCLMATLQSATIAFFLEKNPEAWIIHSSLEVVCCLFAGIIGSGLSFFVQAWCISKRGPLFSAMFNPLCTVIVTILASLFLHEEIYTGSLIGAFAVVIGLYVVLWGKAKEIKEETDPESRVEGLVDDDNQYKEKRSFKTDLEEPLLSDLLNINVHKTRQTN